MFFLFSGGSDSSLFGVKVTTGPTMRKRVLQRSHELSIYWGCPYWGPSLHEHTSKSLTVAFFDRPPAYSRVACERSAQIIRRSGRFADGIFGRGPIYYSRAGPAHVSERI